MLENMPFISDTHARTPKQPTWLFMYTTLHPETEIGIHFDIEHHCNKGIVIPTNTSSCTSKQI